ncbi:MAG: transcriptional repressor LexA [Eubacteriales bacterium]|nr:transcriptional repressor LexA [Eubacteriales bacterium]
MRTKDPELMKQILEYIEDYYIDHNASPSTTQIAEQMGIARGTVHKYLVEMDERGMLSYQGRNITTERTEKMHTSTFRAAVVGDISCGLPDIAEEHIEEYVSLPESMFGSGEFYIFRIRDEFMIEAGVDPGDLVVIRRQETAENGQIAVVLVDEEATMKRFYIEDDRVRLHPENSEIEDFYVDNCIIQGVAVKVIKDLR